jgi:hypothetical protein
MNAAHTGPLRPVIAALAALALVGSVPAPAGAAPLQTVITSIDQVQTFHADAAKTRPEIVTWRSTAEVESESADLVLQNTLGPLRTLDRSAIGSEVPPDYPVTIRGRVHTPQCDGSYDAARWMSGSDFVSGGRFWAGLEGSTASFTGYRQSRAPDGSQQQWAELGVGGFDRFPPQTANPGGHIEGSLAGSSFHSLKYLDPSGSCFIGGVKRVEGGMSFGVASYRAVGGDVRFGGDEDLPTLRVPVVNGPSSVSVVWTGGMPGLSVDASAVVVADENGKNTEVVLRPYVQNPGTWHESRPSAIGMNWQLRFYVIGYWDQPYTTLTGGQPVEDRPTGAEVGSFSMAPGERALVMSRGSGGSLSTRRFRADDLSELRISDGGASLASVGPSGTPFAELNSCDPQTWDGKLSGLPVKPPDRSDDAGQGTPVQGSGIGDPDLPYSVPPGWLGFDLDVDQGGAYTLRNVTVLGQEVGELSLPHVRIDGVVYPLTADKAIEGPIVSERQVVFGDHQSGYTWNQLMMATVYRVAGVEFTLYWMLLGRVIADSRGVAACGHAQALVSDGLNPDDHDIQLQWFIGADLEGHGQTYTKAFKLGENQLVAAEKTVDRDKPFWDQIDSTHYLRLYDKADPDLRWLYQEVFPGAGSTTLAVDHGIKASAPRNEVDGESLDGTRIGFYLTEEPQPGQHATFGYLGAGRNGVFTSFPILLLPCTPVACP